jgi:hypothetical protein
MASANEQIVNAPLVAGIDAYTDPNNLAPPALLRADNVTMVNKSALQTRYGFSLVEATAGNPATAFDGDARPSASVEALSRYENSEGERTLLASGSKLYEYVGSSATRGWRTVNRLPEHIGTLHAVTSSGGSVIEVDSMPDDTNALIVTAWVTGPRTGQEFSSDLAYANLVGTTAESYGNIVYYAVQRASDGTFAVPPTVLQANGGTTICNLRITKVWTSASTYRVLIAWQEATNVRYKVLNTSTMSLSAGYTLGTVGQRCFRSFDVTGASWGSMGQPAIVWAACSADLGALGPAPLYAELTLINASTGAPTVNASIANAMAKTPPGAGDWYEAWAQRGVVLEQEAGDILSLSARVITQLYSPVAVPTGKLDGQLWTVTLATGPATLTRSAAIAQIPFIGFQTRDNHDNVIGAAVGTTNVSGNVQVTRPLTTVAAPVIFTPGALLTPITITGVFPDTTIQTYIAATSIWSQSVAPPALGSTTYAMYVGLQKNIAGFTQNIAQTLGLPGGFPEPTHRYSQDAPVQINTSNSTQITHIDLTALAGLLTGFTPGVWPGCAVQNGANTICTVTVYVNPAGVVTEVAIDNGLPGLAPPGLNPNNAIAITNIVIPGPPFVWPAGGLAYAHTYGRLVDFIALDAPGRAQRTTNTQYVQDGAIEQCVHRWDVTRSADQTFIALSSVSANLMTTPNGDEPYGAAEPHNQGNFFEIYKWDEVTDGLLVNTTGSTTNNAMVAALGGPWRLVGGLKRDEVASILHCAVTPGGDEYQRNTFMIRVDLQTAINVRFPATAKSDPAASDYFYYGNPGVFVESANMMRVTSAPLNVPSSRVTSAGFACGALRDGSSRGTQEVFYIEYEKSPQNWRRMVSLCDYTFVNGGVLSAFDGVGVNEAIPLMWPQKDLTSINWPKVNPDLFIVSDQGSQQNALATYVASAFYDRRGANNRDAYCVVNITRPFWKYEAGLNDKTGYANPLGCGWGYIRTFFGGNPAENYEAVYADQRAAQFSFSKSSYANGWNESNEEKQHYYGRYQSNVRDYGGSNDLFALATTPSGPGNTALLLWAPRAERGWGALQKNLYSPQDAGGDFLMRWTYEYIDGTGRVCRSAPSSPIAYTVCAEIQGAWYDRSTSSYALPYTGGTVTKFKWGFFVPRLELTNRLETAEADPRRMMLQPYTTAEPYSTVLYRMPQSSFESPAGAFVIDRNATRGVVPFVTSPYTGTGTAPLGYVVNNFSLFDGPQKDYNGLLAEPILYTTGNVLDNVPPPSARAMCVHQNRIVLGGADDPTVIWFSKELNSTEAPGFNDTLTFTLEEGGSVTGLASLESALVIFKQNDIFVISGTMPDATGYAPSLSTPIKLPHGIGCRDHRSVIETPVGIFFLSDRTIELLKPDLGIEPVGLQFSGINGFDASTVTSVAHNPETQEVYFTYYVTTDPQRRSQVAVFNYGLPGWMRWLINPLGTAQVVAVVNSKPEIAAAGTDLSANPQALYYRQNTIYADYLKNQVYEFIPVAMQTAPFSMHNIQGYERVKRASILTSRPVTGSYPTVTVTIGGPAASPQIATWTPTELATFMGSTTTWSGQLEVHVAEQKNRTMTIGFQTSGTGAANNVPIRLAGFAFRIGLKAGFNKRTTEAARH